MVPWTRVGAFVVAAAILAPAVAPAAPAGDGPSAADLARIRRALEAPPPRWQVPAAAAGAATFRVEVRQDLAFIAPIDEPPFDPTYGLPSVGDLLVGGIGKIGSAVSNYKQNRTKRRAKKEVQDELAAFCAVNPCPAAAPK